MMEQAIRETERMLTLLQTCNDRFDDVKKRKTTYSFEEVVQPFVREADEQIASWYECAQKAQRTYSLQYVQRKHIDETKQAMEQLVVQSFFLATSRAMYKRTAQANEYRLKTLLDALQRVRTNE